MKKWGKENQLRKNVWTLLCTIVLFSSTFSALTVTAQGSHSSQPVKAPTDAPPSFEEILSENFTDRNMPPVSDVGPWTLLQTNPTETWHIDNTLQYYPVSKPSATVNRNLTTANQDEWLITPSLNFSKYTIIYLQFWWYTCYYVTLHLNHRYLEFNISVSTDGGTNWEKIWSFNDNISGFFTDWHWYEISNTNPIVLSKYAGKPDVKIGFQYYSHHTELADEQVFSIDDIKIVGNGSSVFTCDAGGPYEWWWPMQYEYTPAGVRFHGNVTGAGLHITQWLWDFGDGNTSTIPFYPYHFYNEIGIYNVTLTVVDNTTSPARIAFNRTTVNLFLLKPPQIDIEVHKMISLGIVADIKNGADYNASFVNWTMKISWGPLQIFGKTVANGTCNCIVAKSSETVRSPMLFFGFGRMHIIVSAYPENIPGLVKHYNGLKIGPIVFVLRESSLR